MIDESEPEEDRRLNPTHCVISELRASHGVELSSTNHNSISISRTFTPLPIKLEPQTFSDKNIFGAHLRPAREEELSQAKEGGFSSITITVRRYIASLSHAPKEISSDPASSLCRTNDLLMKASVLSDEHDQQCRYLDSAQHLSQASEPHGHFHSKEATHRYLNGKRNKNSRLFISSIHIKKASTFPGNIYYIDKSFFFPLGQCHVAKPRMYKSTLYFKIKQQRPRPTGSSGTLAPTSTPCPLLQEIMFLAKRRGIIPGSMDEAPQSKQICVKKSTVFQSHLDRQEEKKSCHLRDTRQDVSHPRPIHLRRSTPTSSDAYGTWAARSPAHPPFVQELMSLAQKRGIISGSMDESQLSKQICEIREEPTSCHHQEADISHLGPIHLRKSISSAACGSLAPTSPAQSPLVQECQPSKQMCENKDTGLQGNLERGAKPKSCYQPEDCIDISHPIHSRGSVATDASECWAPTSLVCPLVQRKCRNIKPGSIDESQPSKQICENNETGLQGLDKTEEPKHCHQHEACQDISHNFKAIGFSPPLHKGPQPVCEIYRQQDHRPQGTSHLGPERPSVTTFNYIFGKQIVKHEKNTENLPKENIPQKAHRWRRTCGSGGRSNKENRPFPEVIGNHKSKTTSPEIMSLQEALELRRPDFICNSQERVQKLELKVRQRKTQKQDIVISPGQPTNQKKKMFTVPDPLSDNLFKPKERAISNKEMQRRSKRIYNSLPEVKKKKEEEEKRMIIEKNRLRAQLFKKKLLDQILQRTSD